MGRSRAAFVAAALIAAHGSAWAQAHVVPAGQESLAGRILGSGMDLPAGCRFVGATLGPYRIEARYECASVGVALELRHPDDAPDDARATPKLALLPGPGTPPELSDWVFRRMGELDGSWRWASTEGGGRNAVDTGSAETRLGASTAAAREAITWTVMALVLVWLGAALRRAFRPHRQHAKRFEIVAVAVVLTAFVAVAWSLPSRGPVHDHNNFVARFDCARDPSCDGHAPPGWFPPAYHAFRLLLLPLRYRTDTTIAVSLALTVAALLLQYLFVRRLASRSVGIDRGRTVALWSLALVALNPMTWRLAVAATFWPWALVCLWGAGLAALDVADGRGWSARLGAAALLSLASLSAWPCLVLAPLVVLAPLAWRPRPARPLRLRHKLPLLLVPALILPYAWSLWNESGRNVVPHALIPPMERVRATWEHLIVTDSRLTPLPVLVLSVLGLAVLVRHVRMASPVLYAAAGLELLLGFIQPLEAGYPVRLLHGFVSLFFIGLFAGVGAERLCHHAAERLRVGRRPIMVGLAAILLASAPLATEALAFTARPIVFTTEAVLLSKALDGLPDHDALVILPRVIDEPLPGCPLSDREPYGVIFPREEYQEVMRLHGYETRTLDLEGFLAEGEIQGRTGVVLVYVGSVMKSFYVDEIATCALPDDLERPPLRRLRESYDLDPVVVFTVSTEQHRFVKGRLAADRVRDVDLGFYRLRPRPRGGATRPPAASPIRQSRHAQRVSRLPEPPVM